MSRYGLTASGANTEPLGVRRKDRIGGNGTVVSSGPNNDDMLAEEIRDTPFNNTALFTNNGDHSNIGGDESSAAVDGGQLEHESRDNVDRRPRRRDSRSRSRDRDRHHHKRHREKHRKRSRSQSRDRSEKRRRSRSRDRKRDKRSRDRDRDSYDDYRNDSRRPSHDDRSSQRRDLNGRDYESQQHQATFGPALPPVTSTGMTNAGFNMSGDNGSATDFNFMKQPGTPGSQGSAEDTGRKRKSRWSKENEKAFVPGMPTMLPSNLTDEQRNAYLLQLQIEDITRKLRTSDLGIPANPEERSPSPEPVYDSHGKRLNTREVRVRAALETKRHQLILEMQKMNPIYKPPPDYKAPTTKLNAKVFIPQDRHPEINFVGLLIGPRGITLKQLETETGARIIIRGKGSVKEGKIAKRDGPLPGEDEPLHAYITASDPAAIERAVKKIEDTIRQTLEVPDGENDFRKEQLRQLALLNGTLRPEDMALSLNRCSNCGANTHKSWECPDKPNVTASIYCTSCGGAGHIAKDCKNQRPGGGMAFGAALDDEYSALMAELGEGGTSANSGGGAVGVASAKPIMRVNLARPRPPPLMSVSIGTGPPMMPPAGTGAGANATAPWMPMPGMGAPPMWGGWPPMPPPTAPTGMMPPPPPPTSSSSGVEDMKIDDPANPDGTSNDANGSLPPPMIMGGAANGGSAMAPPPPPWPIPPMMPPFPMFPMGGPAPPPPPPPPPASSCGVDSSSKDQAHLFMPPPPPPPP